MDNPLYPLEWRNLRLELKDNIKLKTIKKEDKVKVENVISNEKIDDLKNKDKERFKFCNCM